MTAAPDFTSIRALCFDVFGTVVDWYGSVQAEVLRLRLPLAGPGVEPARDAAGAFALAWRAGYAPAMDDVRSGRLPWTNLDGLHRRILEKLLAERGIALAPAEAAELNRVWHRLQPWPDSVAGLGKLKRDYIITTLSNGHVALLLNMAKHAGLPWDTVLSAELFGHYKPDPEVYLGAAAMLGLQPAQVMMVAAHPSDLRAAAACGLRTAYVPRPLERGPSSAMEACQDGEFDLAAADFNALAQALGAG